MERKRHEHVEPRKQIFLMMLWLRIMISLQLNLGKNNVGRCLRSPVTLQPVLQNFQLKRWSRWSLSRREGVEWLPPPRFKPRSLHPWLLIWPWSKWRILSNRSCHINGSLARQIWVLMISLQFVSPRPPFPVTSVGQGQLLEWRLGELPKKVSTRNMPISRSISKRCATLVWQCDVLPHVFPSFKASDSKQRNCPNQSTIVCS